MSLLSSELKLLTDRFDRVDQDNAEIKTDISSVKLDVARHSMYWDITRYAGYTTITSLLAYFGWTKSH